MLTTHLNPLVDQRTREKGLAYYRAHRVWIVRGDTLRVDAFVQGTERYEVDLFRDGNAIDVSCTCPAYESGHWPCKHIWATLLAAEAQNLLAGDDRSPPDSLTFGESGSESDFEPSDEYATFQADTASRPPATPDTSKGRTEPRRTPTPPWKAALKELRESPHPGAAAGAETLGPGQELLYIVDLTASLAAGALMLEIAIRIRKRDGDWSKPQSRRFSRREVERLPDPADRTIFSLLIGAQEQMSGYYSGAPYYQSVSTRLQLTFALAETALPIACATGRCYVRMAERDDPLTLLHWDGGAPWELWLAVVAEESSARYAIRGELRRGDERLDLRAAEMLTAGGLVFWQDRVALLRDAGAFPWVLLLRKHGEIGVPAAQADALLSELFNLPSLPPLDLPLELRCDEQIGTPQPFLKITARDRSHYESDRYLRGELLFEYDGHVVSAESAAPIIYEPENRRLLRRDADAERALSARLDVVGFERRRDYGQRERLELLTRHLPRVARTLLEEGWRVEAEGKLYRQPSAFRIEVNSGIDWFELHGGASYGGQEISLPALLAALRRGDDLVPLGDGSFGVLPEEWLKKYGLLAQTGTAEDDHIRFGRTQAGLLDVLLSEQPEVRFDATFEKARQKLRAFQGVEPADAPKGFEGELRGYQREGLGWLHFLREFGFGGCLADDMGLGKTVQVLALLESRRALRRSRRKKRPPASLVVVPRSLVFNWMHEAARFAPKLRVLNHTGLGRVRPGSHFDDHDAVLTTYGTLRRDIADLKDYAFDYAILDEAQAIKNASSQSAKASRLIHAEYRLALSGTPVENHLGELWSLFEFLNPGMLGTASPLGGTDGSAFRGGDESRSLLARALRPYLLRRTKAQVARDLPEKTEQTIYCDLEPAQRKLYDELRNHYRSALLGRVASEGIRKSKIQILEALLRLRQAACHPWLIDKGRSSDDSSAKLDALLPQLREVFDAGHKTLVFSQFTSFLAIVRERLNAENVPYEYLDGRTRDRQAKVDRFQTDPECKVFLISLKAGGLGLNLTAAEYVFLLDPWWNPAVESQAIDRAHRIGQTRAVFAYRLIARATVEEKVLQLQAEKRSLADAIITADNSLIRDLGREDLELLLS